MNPSQVTISNCDKEPIHIPGSIQTHGVLLAIDEVSLKIVQASINTEEYLKIPIEALCEQPLSYILDTEQMATFSQQLEANKSLKDLNPLVWKLPNLKFTFEVSLHRSGGLLIAELVYSKQRLLNEKDEFYFNSHRAIKKIEAADNLLELLDLAAHEIKNLTGIDRVMIYKFHADGHGEVITETKQANLEPFLGLHYPASDISAQARVLYLKNRIRIISDVNSAPVVLFPQSNPILDEALDLSYAHLRSVSPLHIQYLKNMGVRASMSLSIVIDNKLWGLIACHNYQSPLLLNYEERAACQLISQLLAWRIHNYELETKNEELLQKRYYVQSLYQALSQQVEQHVNLQNALEKHEEDLLALVNADGVVICHEGRYLTLGYTPSLIETKKVINYILAKTGGSENLFFTDNLLKEFEAAAAFKERASGVLSIVLAPSEGDIIIWFRREILQTINWAGNPQKAVIKLSQTQQLTPRQSFALWQQEKIGYSLPWQASEVEIATEFKRYLLEVALKYYYNTAVEESRLRRELSSLHKNQEEFIDKICHELRNPINGILGSTLLIEDELMELKNLAEKYSELKTSEFMPVLNKQIAEIQNNLQSIKECGDHQTVIANDVLNLSKLQQGKMQLESIPFNLVSILNSAVKIFNAQCQEKNINLVQNYSADKIILKGDPTRIKQIIINLLSNAFKFTTQGGIIELSLTLMEAEKNHHCYQIKVRDTGIGMTMDEQSNLFKPFVQANEKISSDYGGSGLGLSISHQLVKLMGGSIQVQSKKNEGSTFSFTIKLETLSPQEQYNFILQNTKKAKELIQMSAIIEPSFFKPGESLATMPTSANKQILIVEDNKINRRILLNILQKAGYTCDEAINGEEGLRKFTESKYDAIFMDIEMPVMSGLEAAICIREIEEKSSLPKTPIICLSGNVRNEQQARSSKAGMNLFIAKPFQGEEILRALEKFLSVKVDKPMTSSVNNASL